MNKTCSLRNNEIKFIFSYFYVFFFVTSFIFLQCIKYYNKNLLQFKEELENEKNKNKYIKDKNNWFLDTKIE
jgi:hypothetical protein